MKSRHLLLFILASLACLSCACGGKSVAKVSTERDAIEVIDVLKENGFDVGKDEVTEGDVKKWSVEVNEGWFDDATAVEAARVLHDYDLPRRDEAAAGGNDESSGLLPPSEGAERAREIRKTELKIEQKLRIWPGVKRVNVALVFPEEASIRLNEYPASASVTIVHKEPKPAFTAEQVQDQVAKSVPNLKPSEVSVAMSYQPLRPIPRQELNLRRNNKLLLVIGGSLVAILSFLLIVLFVQMRRQRAQLAALLEEHDLPAGETDELDAGDDQHRLGKPDEANGSGNSPRQLSGAVGEDSSDDAEGDTASPVFAK